MAQVRIYAYEILSYPLPHDKWTVHKHVARKTDKSSSLLSAIVLFNYTGSNDVNEVHEHLHLSLKRSVTVTW